MSQKYPQGVVDGLFEFSFEVYVTPVIVKATYVVSSIVLVLCWLFWTAVTVSQSAALGVFVFLFGGVLVVLCLALIRIILEVFLAIVRMSEDVHRSSPG